GKVRVDIRFGVDNSVIRKHAGELAALAPDVILANSSAAVGPLLQVTRTVPIVFAVVADPVGAGFVESLARPGGNATGFSIYDYEIREVAGAAQGDRAEREASGGHSRSRRRCRARPVRCDPGDSAVTRLGSNPSQLGSCTRYRAHHSCVRAFSECRSGRYR